MGFWQGLNEGLTYVMEDKARKKELEAARQERASERQADIALEEKRFERTRELQLQDQKAASKLAIDKNLMEYVSKTSLYDTEAKDRQQELSVLKAMGASEEVLAQAATLDKASLQEAVTFAKKKREEYAGSPLEFGSAGLNAFISSAVTTVKSGKAPNMEVAARMFGIAPEDMEKPFVEGMTYKEAIAKALTLPATQETTFIGTDAGAPLKLADIETIKGGAEKSLLDALNQRSLVVSSEAAALNTKNATTPLTEEERKTVEKLNEQIDEIRIAKEELAKGSVGSSINLVGGQALIPYFTNAPTAMKYDFGPEWQSATSRYTFNTREEMLAAFDAKRVFVGDYVIIAGKPGRIKE